MSNCNDIKIVMNLISDGGSTDKFGIPIQQGSLEDINEQRNKFIKQSNEVLIMFDYAIDEHEDWKKVYFDGEIDG
jgi:hypothetical protein